MSINLSKNRAAMQSVQAEDCCDEQNEISMMGHHGTA